MNLFFCRFLKMRITILFLLVLSISVMGQQESRRPNIILIMADDMGFSDIGAYGGEINTPNLDFLAQNGLRFTQFYNTARCCPTRASLLTGLYPHQAGMGHMVYNRGTHSYQGDLSRDAVTIAEVLKQSGYSTYMSGKWHITPYVIENPDKSNWPKQRGFDRFFGMIAGAGSYYDPLSLTLENEYVAPKEGFYATTEFTNYAVKYIKEHTSSNPFFLYLPYTAAHWPMHAPAQEVKKYKGKYDQGWDVLRNNRYEKMKKMGVIDKNWSLSQRDSLIEAWSDDVEDKAWEIANMEVYAAMVDIMDQGIGEIIDILKTKGELENTLIFFLQDNGACAEDLSWKPSPPADTSLQPMAIGELQTKGMPERTRDGRQVKKMKDAWPGPADGYTAYGRNWANASNTPFREYKHWVHEGGIASPLIVHWPDGIKVNGGSFERVPSHLIDIMATCVEVSGASYPKEYNDRVITPLEGQSLSPLFQDNEIDERELYWEHEGNRALRKGKWKIVSKVSKTHFEKTPEILPISDWELFDMEKDRTETRDLAKDYPDLVKELSDRWMVWAKRTKVIPIPRR
ncbi:arylsulfatase [Eudoraea chungangensis]|uniref:arylsulfatase n=1 Tax=Eudoraea chungangensis TaxID=1481905 RepID=UPI0023ECB894|nr:arylsulfatase [Eudoraea chungangensis]